MLQCNLQVTNKMRDVSNVPDHEKIRAPLRCLSYQGTCAVPVRIDSKAWGFAIAPMRMDVALAKIIIIVIMRGFDRTTAKTMWQVAFTHRLKLILHNVKGRLAVSPSVQESNKLGCCLDQRIPTCMKTSSESMLRQGPTRCTKKHKQGTVNQQDRSKKLRSRAKEQHKVG